MNNQRRKIIKRMAALPFLFMGGINGYASPSKHRISYSVNAYSFNSELRASKMTLFDMMEFAAEIGLNAVDLTGYYFPNYPEAPSDVYLFKLKRKALELGLDISWTGVRNNFAVPDSDSRQKDIQLITKWLTISAKLGSPFMRIFAGKGSYGEHTKDEVKAWMIDDLKTCAAIAEKQGVLLGLQHHNDFLFTSDEVIDILESVDSSWLGLNLDIGSLSGNTYAEIEKLAPLANYWFIKEYVYPDGKKTKVDMDTIAKIISKTDYKGYISFESLSDGNPKELVAQMFNDFKLAFEKI